MMAGKSIQVFFKLIQREILLAIRHGSDSCMIVLFFVIVVVLFPLSVGPEPGILTRISAGIIWVSALLSVMLSMDRLFQSDYEDGSLDLLILASEPLELIVLAKTVAHWLTTGFPLIIISPVLALFLNMDTSGYSTLLIALTLGTPTLSLVGAIGAALILGARRSGVLLSLLVLPLFIPILIFGVSAVDASLTNLSSKPQLLILGGLFLAGLVLCPWASAAALRQAAE
jgi:heme exporter protein B